MKLSMDLGLVVVTIGLLAACSSEEELHSSGPCLEGQHQECKGDDEAVRCTCVENEAGASDGGSVDGDQADAGAD